MANAKKKDDVVITNAVPFSKENDIEMQKAFAAAAKADDAFDNAAESLYANGVKAEMFYLFHSNDEKETARLKAAFSAPCNAHVRKIATLAKFGEEGYKLLSLPKELRPKSRNEEYRIVMKWVNQKVEFLANTLRSVENSEKEKNGDEEKKKREKASLLEMLDGALAELMKSALTFKGKQDVPAADAALILREARKQIKALAVTK